MAGCDYRGGFLQRGPADAARPLRRQQQHFPLCRTPKREQLPYNLFLMDANAGTPVIATAASPPPQYNPKKITHVGSRYSWINY